MIKAKDEDSAKKAIEDLNRVKVGTIYMQYTTDKTYEKSNGQLLPLSTSTSVDSAIQDAAFKLAKTGDYTTDPVTSNGSYYVIRLDKTTKKPSLNSVRTQLTDKLVTNFLNDQKSSDKVQAIIGKILRQENVDVKDAQLKNALNAYLTAGLTANKSK